MEKNNYRLLKKLMKNHHQLPLSAINNKQTIKSLMLNGLVNETLNQNLVVNAHGQHVFEKVFGTKLNHNIIFIFMIPTIIIGFLLLLLGFGLILLNIKISNSANADVMLCVVLGIFYGLMIPFLIEIYYEHRYCMDISRYMKCFRGA